MSAAAAAAAPAPVEPVLTQVLTTIDTDTGGGDIAAIRAALTAVEDTPDAHVNQAVPWVPFPGPAGPPLPLTAIILATHRKLPEVVQLLLDHGADPNLQPRPRSYTPLTLAAFRGYVDVARVLLDSGLVDIDLPAWEGGESPLYRAIRGSNPLEMVPLLIARGANVNTATRYGWTPLHYAVRNKRISMCELLIDAGADTEAQNDRGSTPGQLALARGGSEIAATLLDPVNLEARRVWRLEQRVANRSRMLEMIDRFTGRELQERHLLPIVCGYLGWDKFASLGDDMEWFGIATREDVREWEVLQGQ